MKPIDRKDSTLRPAARVSKSSCQSQLRCLSLRRCPNCFKILCAAIILAALAPAASSQSWTNVYIGPGNISSLGFAIAADRSGSVYVAGSSAGHYGTIKYSPAGAALWTNLYNAGLADFAHTIAVDNNSNVYVTGNSAGIASGNDFATIKYTSAGAALWTNRYNGPGNGDDNPNAIAVDANGNTFVAGYSIGLQGNYEYATIKYSPAGAPLWTNRYNGPGNNTNQATSLALDASGNAFVTGYSIGISGYYEYATLKYSNSGQPLWTNRYSGAGIGHSAATSLAVDKSGNVFVTGEVTGASGNYDYATLKYSSSGALLWVNGYNGPANGDDGATSIALDQAGNVYVTGVSTGLGTSNDFTTIAYSNSGQPLWTNRYSGPGSGDDHAFSLAVDGAGNVYVTGYSTIAGGTNIYATLAYANAGTPMWTNFYNGNGASFSRPFGIVADDLGNIVITGESTLPVGRSYVTIRYGAQQALSISTAPGSFGYSNGHFGFKLTGPTGSSVVIQASSDLLTWTPVETNILAGGVLAFTDPQSSLIGRRFYRASLSH